eukprot:m.339444 g.339444  ORF g.339444 m.339444 type:complete len:442 (+) comp18807_c0_seq1:13-1338(+)
MAINKLVLLLLSLARPFGLCQGLDYLYNTTLPVLLQPQGGNVLFDVPNSNLVLIAQNTMWSTMDAVTGQIVGGPQNITPIVKYPRRTTPQVCVFASPTTRNPIAIAGTCFQVCAFDVLNNMTLKYCIDLHGSGCLRFMQCNKNGNIGLTYPKFNGNGLFLVQTYRGDDGVLLSNMTRPRNTNILLYDDSETFIAIDTSNIYVPLKHVFRFDAKDGKKLWNSTLSIDFNHTMKFSAGATMSGTNPDWLYIGTQTQIPSLSSQNTRAMISKFSLETGRELTHRYLEGQLNFPLQFCYPSVGPELIITTLVQLRGYQQVQTNFTAMDAETLDLVWSKNMHSSYYFAPYNTGVNFATHHSTIFSGLRTMNTSLYPQYGTISIDSFSGDVYDVMLRNTQYPSQYSSTLTPLVKTNCKEETCDAILVVADWNRAKGAIYLYGRYEDN